MAPLRWSDRLAGQAGHWARQLAHEGRFAHADRASRNGSGENLWMGTAGRYSPQEMVGRFVEERQYYSAGTFPDVSTTGRWQDVGHYTQIVWRETREVGCAIASGGGRDVLVSRYWPAGNVIGQRPY